MKTLTLIPLTVAAALGTVAVLCRLGDVAVHGKEALVAGIITVIAAEAAVVPAWLMRRSEAVRLAQVALGGTVLHLILTILLAIAVIAAKSSMAREPFVYWLIAGYWTALGALVWALLSLLPGKTNGKVPQCN